MAANRTEISKYPSNYGGGFISANQKLAEIMCERQATKSQTKLKPKFWNEKEWLKEFKLQLRHAKALLEDYAIEVILEAFEHWKLKNVYSLGARYAIDPICKEIAQKRANAKILSEDYKLPEVTNEIPVIKTTAGKGGLRNLLRD